MMHRVFLFVTVVASVTICSNANIFRSNCRRDGLFRATDKGKRLALAPSGILQTFDKVDLPFCARQCTSSNKCRSLNYKSTENSQCKVLSFDKANQSVTLENAPEWNHYEPIQQIGPRCRLVACNPGFQCVERCNILIGYECIDIDECQSSPCLNGGTCNNLVNKYTCTCVAGYTGTNCQTDINECSSSPCKNGGTCSDLINKYRCTCVPGYTGINCETDINECSSSPCLNGGTCSNLINRYNCSCSGGYTGTNCQTDINECSSSPCLNGGTCSNLINRYTCSCSGGYTGTNCQTDINECSSSPCVNGGTCSNLINRYTCSCSAGYTGTNCETDINECSSSPCLNGGTCSNLINRYTCSCSGGFTGTNCQADINECSSSPCQNGGTCNNLVNKYSCTCASGFGGTKCESGGSGTCGSITYTYLTEADRNINFYDGSSKCDSGLLVKWYRFGGSAGTLMYTSCPEGYGSKYRCKTAAGGWFNGQHPSTSEGIVTREVCFAWASNCCFLRTTTRVLNCGGYYIYELQKTPGCSLRYCAY